MSSQTDLQLGSRIRASRKFHAIRDDLRLNLCRLALGGQTVKNLRRLAYKFELDQRQCKPSQFHAKQFFSNFIATLLRQTVEQRVQNRYTQQTTEINNLQQRK